MKLAKLLHSQGRYWRKKITCSFKISGIFPKVPNTQINISVHFQQLLHEKIRDLKSFLKYLLQISLGALLCIEAQGNKFLYFNKSIDGHLFVHLSLYCFFKMRFYFNIFNKSSFSLLILQKSVLQRSVRWYFVSTDTLKGQMDVPHVYVTVRI